MRHDFPMLSTQMNDKPLVYLDNAATTLKPKSVIDTLTRFYSQEYATIHRGVYSLSQNATQKYDEARVKVQRFLHAKSPDEIIFVRGTTEAINLVAAAYGTKFLSAGDEILISEIEHHANIVPWQQVCKATGAKLRVIPVLDDGELDFTAFEKLLNTNTKLVAIAHVSNALGTIHPIAKMIQQAHEVGAKVLIDGAQGAPHTSVDVTKLDCDFYCFSSHKLYGPTGVGVLYGKSDLLDRMDVYQCGGDMIESVSLENTTFAKAPAKFEAGTPAIAEAIGLGAAIDYITQVGFEAIESIESSLLKDATQKLSQIPGLTIIGTAPQKAAVISFKLDGIHPHDIGTILDTEGVAIRAGHHCAQPAMRRFGVSATARASFSFYNTTNDVDVLVTAILKAKGMFR